jgi:integrase/recombinase XerC
MSRVMPGGDLVVADVTITAHLRYLEQSGLAASTVEARRRALTRLQGALDCPLLEAGAADLAAWRAALTIDPDSVGDYVSHVRQFYAWAIEASLGIYINPAEKLPVPKRSRRVPRPISEPDLFSAMAGAPPRIKPWLVLAGWCGLRAKEIALLRRENILDSARPPVLIIARDATKGHHERVVPLHPYALAQLLEAGLPASGYVFRRRDGAAGPNTPTHVSQLANLYLHSAGFPETLHQLRHRFGTSAYRVKRDLRLVQELMGHLSPQTTAGYVLVDQADAAAVVEQIPAPGQLRVVSE